MTDGPEVAPAVEVAISENLLELRAGFDRRSEVEALLAKDETVLGRLFVYDREQLSTAAILEKEGVPSQGWISSYRSLVRVLRDGEIPNGPTVAQQGARRVRSWLRSKELSAELRDTLTAQEALLNARAEDRVAKDEEVKRAVAVTEIAEAQQTPGIYVYTLPHYLRHPYHEESGRTLLKVGHSAVDAHYRAASQGRLTALPEDPILLRIYPASASAQVERQFHEWLRDADHEAARTRRGGSEWFLTSTKFLDRIASSLNLELRIINDWEMAE